MPQITLPVHTIDSAPELSRPALQTAHRSFGFVPNLIGSMAESPALVRAVMAVHEEFTARGSLTAPEQQLVLLTVSYANECRYCMATHTGLGQAVGLPSDEVSALRRGESLSDPRLEALRSFTAALIRDRGHVTRGTVDAFLGSGFTVQAALDVIVGIAYKTLSNFTDNLVEAPLDEGLKKWAWTPETASQR
jgi:uncharacterized peroxidase-related enzyme